MNPEAERRVRICLKHIEEAIRQIEQVTLGLKGTGLILIELEVKPLTVRFLKEQNEPNSTFLSLIFEVDCVKLKSEGGLLLSDERVPAGNIVEILYQAEDNLCSASYLIGDQIKREQFEADQETAHYIHKLIDKVKEMIGRSRVRTETVAVPRSENDRNKDRSGSAKVRTETVAVPRSENQRNKNRKGDRKFVTMTSVPGHFFRVPRRPVIHGDILLPLTLIGIGMINSIRFFKSVTLGPGWTKVMIRTRQSGDKKRS